MMSIAEDDFDLKDYQSQRQKAAYIYPILMKSYVEKAISNYVWSIILNYHNHYNSLKETEEIFNEMSQSVICKKNNQDEKYVWNPPSLDQMLKDEIYYSFQMSKLEQVKPALWVVGESPHLLWALWHALTINLEALLQNFAT